MKVPNFEYWFEDDAKKKKGKYIDINYIFYLLTKC